MQSFWGKRMADEEQKWFRMSPWGDELVTSLDDIVLIEGCYFLDLNIKYLNIPRIWIRAEYTTVSRLFTNMLSIGHQPLSLQDNQESVSPTNFPLYYGSS
jgi:hypothetical protein